MAGKSKFTGKAEDDLEILPDAQERFERAVHVMAKAGPQHRISGDTVKKERSASKGRVHKGKSKT
jgi:hypothetical protein